MKQLFLAARSSVDDPYRRCVTNSAVVVETCFKVGGRMGGPAPLTIASTLVSRSTCALSITPAASALPLESLASRVLYLWHVEAFGRYSLYAGGLTCSVATGFTAALSVAVRE